MILALDTAGPHCAACVFDQANNQVLAEKSLDIEKGHCEHLMDVIADVMNKAKLDYSNLTRVATTIGPGSFTGIRVSVAAARGFGLGLDIPVIGISSLEAIYQSTLQNDKSSNNNNPLGVVLSAGRGEAYCQFNIKSEFAAENEPFLARLEELNNSNILQRAKPQLCGNGATELASVFGSNVLNSLSAPPISVVAKLGGIKEEIHNKPEPLYLRKPDAKPQAGFGIERI